LQINDIVEPNDQQLNEHKIAESAKEDKLKPFTESVKVETVKPFIVQVIDYTFSFYKNGEFWSIGEQGKEKHLKDLNGLLMLNMLLRYPHEPISSFTLFHEGKEIESDIVVPFYKVSDDIKSTSSKEGVDTLAISIKPSHQPKYDEGGKSMLKSSIAELEEELALIDQTSFEDPIKKLEKEDEIKGLIQEYKKEMDSNKYQDWATGEDNARVSVNKNIKRALKKVIADIPYLETYLNRHTIVTGKECTYRPLIENPVEWILDPPESPSV
jgi:hypothetical protein